MKKVKYFLISLFLLVILPFEVSAASGTIKVTSRTNQVVVGNRITLTVTLSSSTPIGSWQMNLDYDKNYLELVETSSDSGGSGMASVMQSTTGVKSKSYTFTFRTKKTG